LRQQQPVDKSDGNARIKSIHLNFDQARLSRLSISSAQILGDPLAATLEAIGLMMIGLAKNGAGTWDIASKVDIG
jgi:hypothetical protein